MTQDAQPAKPRDLDTHHLFSPPATRPAWEARRKDLRRQVLFSAGLWPMPRKTPLKPVVTGRVEGDDYTIENVAIETLPGFYLCGNLYRPKGKHGPFPGIVNPHGHWSNGRLEVQADVPPAAPPPAPPADGRGNLVAIGVNLARQGFVVFAYDMVGYNDTNQATHKFAGGLQPWLWDVSLMGLQLWNSIRVVDYLTSLPDVDRKRIGVTGASGGGTQTFLLCAVDDRIAAAVPVNMVSAYMQGGCLCENGPGLRVGTDNVEIAAMLAPKPLLLVSCTGDWTKNVPGEEWPAIRRVYDLYGAGDHTAVVQFNYQHNYNIASREAMYAWFGRWLKGDPNPEHFRERPFEPQVAKQHVWTDAHPRPKEALDEPRLAEALIAASERQLAAAWPKEPAGLKRFADAYLPALCASLAVPLPAPSARPKAAGKHATVVVFASDAEAAATQAAPGQGTVLLKLDPIGPTPDTWQAFFTTYNRTPLGDRVAAIAGTLRRVQQGGGGPVDLVGVGEAGTWALLARAVSGVEGTTTADGSADYASDHTFIPRLYAPGLRRAGDVRSAALLAAMRGPVCINGAGAGLDAAVAAAQVSGLTLTVGAAR